MGAKTHIALAIFAGSILVALTIALYGFPRISVLRHTQTSSIPADSRLAQSACVMSDAVGEENDIFFISCGGIY